MKTKHPKPKTPKTPKSPAVGKTQPANFESNTRARVKHKTTPSTDLGNPLHRAATTNQPGFQPAPCEHDNTLGGKPSPEWLAETALRLIESADTLTNRTGRPWRKFSYTVSAGEKRAKKAEEAARASRAPVLHALITGEVENRNQENEEEAALSNALRAAYRVHNAAASFLANRPAPLPAFFSKDEILFDSLTNDRALCLITGETRPKRARQKWDAYKKSGDGVSYLDDVDERWSPRVVLFAMSEFEKFLKKPIDLTKRQYAPHPSHKAPKGRQKRKRRGPRLPKLSQK